jgi:N-methylhydantoinase A
MFREMEEEGAAALHNEGFAADDRTFLRFIDVRYLGQEHAVSVPVEGLSADDDVERLRQEFSEIHERQYGHAMSDPIEIVTLRSRAIGVVERPRLPEVAERDGDELTPIASREVVQSDGTRIPYQVYDRSHFRFGDRIEGPAIIVEHTSTTVMHTGDTAEVGRVGEIVITLAEEPNHG